MQLIDDRPVYAATDLVGFLWCGHLTQLNRAALAGLLEKPERNDPELELIRKRGFAHEERYLDDLRAQGRSVLEIRPDAWDADRVAQLRESAARTEAAIRAGEDVIYQAAFFDGTWRGHADFLKRVDVPSALGPWSYEVADTKLARSAKASALVQMCVYADLLERIQGVPPPALEVALGGSARAVERFRTADFTAYYRALKARFMNAVGNESPPAYPPVGTYPEPIDHCDVCAWVIECIHRRKADDHLSLVAGITRRQRAALLKNGISTLAALGEAPLPFVPKLEGVSSPAALKIHEQARIQAEGRRQDKVLFELLEPIAAQRGLALLPPPSWGDIFFDMEGDPFVEEGGADGLEYLFGLVDRGEALGLEPQFRAFWGLDRTEEKRSFEAFIDYVTERRRADPKLHVYHYGAYEPSAVKRLMGRHATREEEVDELLRAGVFVDLYRVVQQGVRVSQDSYSIKKLEPLYGLVRTIALKDAGSSIVNFELWLESDGVKQELLDLIREYNRDDCNSNWQLRDWLEERRAEEEAKGVVVPRPQVQEGAAPPAVSEWQARVDALVARLTDGLPPKLEDRDELQQATWLMAQLLDWHRREDKAFWWQYYAHLAMTDEELIESTSAIGGLEYVGPTEQVKASIVHRYHFQPQENEIRVGTDVRDPRTEANPGEVYAIDQAAGTLDLKRGKNSKVEHPLAVIPYGYYSQEDQKQALYALGEWIAEHGVDADGPHRAARDLLLRRSPRAGQPPGEVLARPGVLILEEAKRLALAMDRTTLAIQGPPGSGKTFTGARVIVELIRAGKKVGISATSHKVIGLSLDEVCAAAATAVPPVPLRALQRAKEEERCSSPIVQLSASNGDAAARLRAHEVDVVAGTAWVWSDPDLAGAVDTLVVDEAGQISLANVLAINGAATNVILLGDPRQLQQPSHGSHPPGADASALEHALGGKQTIAPEQGLFLAQTWRLNPELARVTSELFYEGRLDAEPSTAIQDLVSRGELTGTGFRWVPVEHVGNRNESTEEVERVAELAEGLMGATWTDQRGDLRAMDWDQLRIVAPYNAQVARLKERLPEARIGTVDKFQGQEAAVSIYSLTTSSPDLAPRGMEFLYSLNRLNVATSRARCLAVVVGSPALLEVAVQTPRQMHLANALCRIVEVAAAD